MDWKIVEVTHDGNQINAVLQRGKLQLRAQLSAGVLAVVGTVNKLYDGNPKSEDK